MAKRKIQVVTTRVESNAQVILPNCYFIVKAAKAQLAYNQLRDYMKMMEADGHPVDNYIRDQVETAGNFLNELIDALEDKDDESGN